MKKTLSLLTLTVLACIICIALYKIFSIELNMVNAAVARDYGLYELYSKISMEGSNIAIRKAIALFYLNIVIAVTAPWIVIQLKEKALAGK